MRNLYNYLYAVSAALFIGVGSSYVSLLPFYSHAEADARRAEYELEQKTGKDSKGINCEEFPELHADCNYVKYLFEVHYSSLHFNLRLAQIMITAGVLLGALGIWLHSKAGSSDVVQ